MLTLCSTSLLYGQGSAVTTPAISPLATVTQRVGISDISITYSRPQVKGREIWGALVPYGYTSPTFERKTFKRLGNKSPWRAGANAATTITFPHDASINNQPIKAGTYQIYIAVFKDGTTDVIFSENVPGAGSFSYIPEETVIKIKVTSEETSAFHEMLTFEFTETTTTSSTIALVWANKKIPFTIEVKDVHKNVMGAYEASINSSRGFMRAAAMYSMNNNIDLDKGIEYIKAVINGSDASRSFPNLTTYANLLMMTGNMSEANKVLDEAFAIPADKIGAGTLNFYGGQALSVGKGFPEAAMRSFKALEEHFPKNKWRAENGYARVYSAKSEFKKAIKHYQEFVKLAPEGTVSEKVATTTLKRLKNKDDINKPAK